MQCLRIYSTLPASGAKVIDKNAYSVDYRKLVITSKIRAQRLPGLMWIIGTANKDRRGNGHERVQL